MKTKNIGIVLNSFLVFQAKYRARLTKIEIAYARRRRTTIETLLSSVPTIAPITALDIIRGILVDGRYTAHFIVGRNSKWKNRLELKKYLAPLGSVWDVRVRINSPKNRHCLVTISVPKG